MNALFTFTCSESTIETLEKHLKYVQSLKTPETLEKSVKYIQS